MLIGLNGRIGAGKDTVGTYLVENYGFERKSYAAKLKEATAALFDMSVDQLENLKIAQNAGIIKCGPEGYPIGSLTWREILQRMGTEVGRDIFGEDFWVDQLFPANTTSADFDFRNVVITDCRFVNEAKRILMMNGKVILIERGISSAEHRSEHELPRDMLYGIIPNYKTLEDLYDVVDHVMWTLKIEKITNAA